MTDQELNRVVQYVTASTSHSRETVDQIIRVSMTELVALGTTSSWRFDRAMLLEYICQWTLKTTGHPEPLVREILGCAGRWLDDLCLAVLGQGQAVPHTREL